MADEPKMRLARRGAEPSACYSCRAPGMPESAVAQTLMAGGGDCPNVGIRHDPNTFWTIYQCVNGHRWIARWVRTCKFCGWSPGEPYRSALTILPDADVEASPRQGKRPESG